MIIMWYVYDTVHDKYILDDKHTQAKLTFRIVIMVPTVPSTTITSSPMKNAYKHSQSTSTQPAMLNCTSIPSKWQN